MWVKTISALPNCHLNQYDTERKVGFKLCIDLLVAYGLFRRMFKNYHLLSKKAQNSFYFSEMLHLNIILARWFTIFDPIQTLQGAV